MATFPEVRLRRLRRSGLRQMLSTVRVHPSSLIYPLFVDANLKKRMPIPSMPGQFRHPLGGLADLCSEVENSGVRAVMLFGIPSKKDSSGSGAFAGNGVIQRAIRKVKENSGLTVAADLCLCEYTDHGHCGIVRNGKVLNDETLRVYARIAVSQASAGADIIAPSGMMDGQVGVIRKGLDREGFGETPVMAYSSKSASSFYDPFRVAAESTPSFGDRKEYQLNFASRTEHMREIEMDIEEGADIVMVKPALTSLDIINRARDMFSVPIAAYNVSGEYSMINACAASGWMNYRGAVHELLTAIFRAGADLAVTYHAVEYAQWHKEGVI
jgi:porphobilinogen synthase